MTILFEHPSITAGYAKLGTHSRAITRLQHGDHGHERGHGDADAAPMAASVAVMAITMTLANRQRQAVRLCHINRF